MAKKDDSPKIILERTYVIPLRKETLKVPPFKKANKAIKTIKVFISKHMKSDDVHIGKHLNLNVWRHGAKNPPHKVKVNVSKDDKGKVIVELVGAPKEQPKAEEKKKPAKGAKEPKVPEKPEEKIEKHIEEVKEEKQEEAKKIEHEEIEEMKKEHPKHHAPKVPQKQKTQEVHPVAPKHV